MNEDIVTTCINGELRPGDMVISTPEDDYAYLVGTVREIAKLGTPEHDTGNAADDVFVDFTEADYSEQRMVELDAMVTKLYGERASFEDCPVDLAAMAPKTLICITDIDQETLAELLDSEEKAAAFCENVRHDYGLVTKNVMEDIADMATKTSTAAREAPAVETREPQAAPMPEVEVNVRPIEPQGKMIAMADVKIGGLTVEGFKVFNGDNGLFVGAPSIKDPSTRSGWRRTARISEDLQPILNEKAFEGYNAAVEKLVARATAAQAMAVKPSIHEGLREGAEQAARDNAERPAPERAGKGGKDGR